MTEDLPAHVVYELLVRDIYQALTDHHSTDDVDVQHNVKVKGRSGQEHQIDVYWEHESAGFRHRVCIEVKNHKRPCNVDIVAAFQSKVEDIGKDVKGIIVSSNGFQEGAVRLAEAKGVGLQTATPFLRSIGIELTLVRPSVKGINFGVSKDEVDPDLLDEDDQLLPHQFTPSHDTRFMVRLEDGEFIAPAEHFPFHTLDDGTHTMDATGYGVETSIGLLPLKKIIVDIEARPPIVAKTSIEVPEDGNRAEIRDVIDGWVKTLREDGRIIADGN